VTVNDAELTVSVVEPLMLPEVAEMVVLPAETAVARPCALIVAAAGVPEFHIAVDVRFAVLLSLYVPVAVNC
jgi:hypothetical protein